MKIAKFNLFHIDHGNDAAFPMHEWCTIIALIVRNRCTNDALSVHLWCAKVARIIRNHGTTNMYNGTKYAFLRHQ